MRHISRIQDWVKLDEINFHVVVESRLAFFFWKSQHNYVIFYKELRDTNKSLILRVSVCTLFWQGNWSLNSYHLYLITSTLQITLWLAPSCQLYYPLSTSHIPSSLLNVSKTSLIVLFPPLTLFQSQCLFCITLLDLNFILNQRGQVSISSFH